MRRIALYVIVVQAAAVAGLSAALWTKSMPLGVPGEWEWQPVTGSPDVFSWLLGLFGVLVIAAIAGIGFGSLSRSPGVAREGVWVLGLAFASTLIQALVQEAAPIGVGLSKWIFALSTPGPSGYYTVAKNQMTEPRKFLADYPEWIDKQDSLHVGTHPPGLFLVAKGMLSLMEASPPLSRLVMDLSPSSVLKAYTLFRDTDKLTRADAASLTLTGVLTMIACALTVVPLYWLARSVLPASAAWASAALWPLVPSALMFQPASDTAFPLLSTSALALACWAGRSGSKVGLSLGFLAGLTLALGMFFTLAFLPVGLVFALVILSSDGPRWISKAGLIAVTGAGFLLGTLYWWWATSANPFVIWWINQRNHGRFYVQFPRSYWAWMVENPIELAIGLGLPATIWALAGGAWPRQVPRVAWATLFVLVILTISGKNLSEVGRLWLPLMPPLLVAAGWGYSRLGGRGWELAGSVVLTGLQVLILEALIQVVYPV